MPAEDPVHHAALDRIVDGAHAVLLVGDDERELVVPLSLLPSGAQPGDRLRVRFDGDTVTEVTVDTAATEAARLRIEEKMQQLRRRGPRTDGSGPMRID